MNTCKFSIISLTEFVFGAGMDTRKIVSASDRRACVGGSGWIMWMGLGMYDC